MKYFGSLFLSILLFSSCLSDEEKRLETDQSFEGEEMFNITYSLDEHIFYAFKPFEFYKDTSNYANISGCPLVTYNEEGKEVSLVFGRECPTNQTERIGKLKLTYFDSLVDQENLVRIDYEEYAVRGVGLEGIRLVEQIDSSYTHVAFRDSLHNFIIRYANNSTSKVNAAYHHYVVFLSDSLRHITTNGSSWGRNLAGRSFEMEITQPKVHSGECIRKGFFIPGAGQESWSFERTTEPEVVHRIHYDENSDCDQSATILLNNGNEMVLSQ
jgi:hypothetical protein